MTGLALQRVHRLHWRGLALAIGLGLVVAALVGILLGSGNSRPQPPSLAGAAQQGSTSPAGKGPPLLSGNPLGGGSSSGSRSGSGSVTVATISVSPPHGWAVVQRDHVSITLSDPAKHGLLGLLSGTLSGSPTATQFGQTLVNAIVNGTTNARICGKVAKGPVPNGPQGLLIPLCYTIVPQNGQAYELFTILAVAVSGNLGMSVKFVTPAQNSILQALISESSSVLPSLKWRLLTQ